MSFFFNDTATTEIYTLSLHDALPICPRRRLDGARVEEPDVLRDRALGRPAGHRRGRRARGPRSEEHTSELQPRQYLVCRLLLEKNNHFDVCYLTVRHAPLYLTSPPAL